MKVLFFHNTAPEYRIPFFQELSKSIDVRFIFTMIDTNKRVYGNEIDYGKLNDINYKIIDKSFRRYVQIFKLITKSEDDVIIIPPLDSLLEYLDGLLIFILGKLKRKKIAYFWEKWEAPKNKVPLKKYFKNSIQKNVCKIILKNIDRCIASGSKSKEYFKSLGVSEKKITTIHDCSLAQKSNNNYDLRGKYLIDKNKKILLYYGRIVERKGLDKLIQAYSMLNLNDDVCLVVAGDGPFKAQCEKMANERKIDNIIFTGKIHPDDRSIFFSQCDIFVLPSYFYNGTVEAWGLTVNEAMQFYKPVISTTAVGSAHDLINGKSGIMVEENNVLQLKNAIEKALDDDFIKNAKLECKNIIEKYTYENMANDFRNSFIFS